MSHVLCAQAPDSADSVSSDEEGMLELTGLRPEDFVGVAPSIAADERTAHIRSMPQALDICSDTETHGKSRLRNSSDMATNTNQTFQHYGPACDPSLYAPYKPSHTTIPPHVAHKLHVRLTSGALALPLALSAIITNKAALADLHLKCAPKTFVLDPRQPERDQKEELLAALGDNAADEQMWIGKPANGSRAEGIVVLHDAEAVHHYIGSECRFRGRGVLRRSTKYGAQDIFVVQRYIADPLLLHGTKFDVRVHVLFVRDKGGRCTAMIHRKSAYARCANGVYAADAGETGVQVTNQCYFDRNEHVGEHTTRHWLPLHAAMSELAIASGVHAAQVWHAICGPVRECMHVLLHRSASADESRKSSVKGPHMHLFGADVLLDERGRAWLLEVNANPVQAFEQRAGDCELIDDIARVAVAEGIDDLLQISDCGWRSEDDANANGYTKLNNASTHTTHCNRNPSWDIIISQSTRN